MATLVKPLFTLKIIHNKRTRQECINVQVLKACKRQLLFIQERCQEKYDVRCESSQEAAEREPCLVRRPPCLRRSQNSRLPMKRLSGGENGCRSQAFYFHVSSKHIYSSFDSSVFLWPSGFFWVHTLVSSIHHLQNLSTKYSLETVYCSALRYHR